MARTGQKPGARKWQEQISNGDYVRMDISALEFRRVAEISFPSREEQKRRDGSRVKQGGECKREDGE